jgi:hypothetical protein
MSRRTIWAWILIILLPLVPVVLLYAFFSNQNYFELKDAARGIVATGPIAAYVAIVALGWKVMSEIEKESTLSIELMEELKGEWSMTSKSIHDTVGQGDWFIDFKRGRLVINGSLSENGENVGRWSSEMSQVKENMLYVFYTLTQVKGEEQVKMDGICTLTFGAPPVKTMQGIWIIVGKGQAAGELTLTKKM